MDFPLLIHKVSYLLVACSQVLKPYFNRNPPTFPKKYLRNNDLIMLILYLALGAFILGGGTIALTESLSRKVTKQ